MSEISIRVEAGRFQRYLSKVSRKVSRIADREEKREAIAFKNLAQRYAPVKTGYLRSKVEIEGGGFGGTRVVSRARYSSYVIGKRYARGPYRGQKIDYMEKARKETEGRFEKGLLVQIRQVIR